MADPHLRPYQEEALNSLVNTKGPVKSLIMHTGSGKTRVLVRYAEKRLDAGSVAYIVETDAHVGQVLVEAKRLNVPAVFIPGANSTNATPEDLKARPDRLRDYDLGLHVGVFSYAGYFLGSKVTQAETLVIDDAHALSAHQYSHSVVELDSETFPTAHRKIFALLHEHNPLLAHQLEGLSRPVHRGGPAVLLPPSTDKKLNEAIHELVMTETEGSGYPAYLLRLRVNSAPYFLSWALVVAAGVITWRPFVLPFESLGGPASRSMKESELVLATATRGTQDFLRLRLGLPAAVNEAKIVSEIPEMGSRLVLPYETIRANNPPTGSQANVIYSWAEAVGSVAVTVTADQSEAGLVKLLGDKLNLLRYVNNSSLEQFAQLEKPRALILVNRPSGIDLSAKLCPVAIHLDLPYSTVGHEVVAGDVERSGTISEASLAIRLSQLLGRLNRSPEERSVHVILAGPIPLQRNGVFTRALDPGVLLDIIIGQRNFLHRYPLPHEPALMEEAKLFLAGDDSVRAKYVEQATNVRGKYLTGGTSEYAPAPDALVEASLLLSRGNFPQATKRFQHFGLEAAGVGANGPAALYDLQHITAGLAVGGKDEVTFGPGGWKSVASTALARNPGSGLLVGALRQLLAEPTSAERVDREMAMLKLRRQGFRFFEKWQAQNEAALGEAGGDITRWKDFWRQRLASADHEVLLGSYIELAQILGSDTPQRSVKSNDARIAWPSVEDQVSLALEVKGRQLVQGKEETELVGDDVVQARDNAMKINAKFVLLATSKFGFHKDVPAEAKARGVNYILSDAAIALADGIAAQCAAFVAVQDKKQNVAQVPFDALALEALLNGAGGEITTESVRKVFALG